MMSTPAWQRVSRNNARTVGSALAGDDRADDAHAGRSRNIRNDMMKLKVHLSEGLLHMLNMRGRVVQQAFALADIRTQFRDLTLWSKACPQQTVRVQSL